MNRILTTKGWIVLLLILSILGLFVFIFVGFFQSSGVVENNPEGELVPETPEVALEEAPLNVCFKYLHEATEKEPTRVEEEISLTIDGEIVTGEKSGTQKSKEVMNGYNGTLEGTNVDNILELVFSYTIEGSEGKELEIYNLSENELVKQRYSLKDEDGTLVPDKESDLKLLVYKKVACENEAVVQ